MPPEVEVEEEMLEEALLLWLPSTSIAAGSREGADSSDVSSLSDSEWGSRPDRPECCFYHARAVLSVLSQHCKND